MPRRDSASPRRCGRAALFAWLIAWSLVTVWPVRAAVESDVQAVGEQLVCYCGCSGLTVAACTCGTSDQIRARIASQLDSGLSTDEVVQAWVDERGEQILAVPTREGFNLVGWIMPFVVSLGGIAFVVVVLLRRQRATPPLSPVPGELTEADRRHLERIEREVGRIQQG